jgi:type IV pilus assembly protein PilC
MNTMIISGIPMVRTIDITATVVGNSVYKAIMEDVGEQVRGGSSVSSSMSQHEEIPNIMVQMTKVGEETGELGNILKTLSVFYRREVDNAVDTLISLIEPAMIVALGLAVGVLVASVLLPIYNLSSAI